MLTTIRSWPTNQRDEIRTRVLAHRAADRIVQRTGWDGERGCAIGCSLERYDHGEYARVLGLPLEVAKLIDAIHESLPPADAVDWPLRVVDALAPGADTTHVWTRFAIWLLREECPSEIGERVAALYERRLAGDEPTADEWEATEATAWVAGENLTWRAAIASRGAGWTAGAARTPAIAMEVANYTAWVAWAHATKVATARAAREMAFQRQADALVRILNQPEQKNQ